MGKGQIMFYFSGIDRPSFIDIVIQNGGGLMLNVKHSNFKLDSKMYPMLLDIPKKHKTLDSAAFQGNTDLDGYCKTLKESAHLFYWYANLDAINNPEQTERNYQEMLNRGFSPLWVFQPGESLDLLAERAENNLVGIGGLVPMKSRQKQYLMEVGQVLESVNGKAHLFGVGTKKILEWVCHKSWFESADCSTWTVGAKGRELLKRCGGRHKLKNLDLALTKWECLANNIRIINEWCNPDKSEPQEDTPQLRLF
jgi:hypothetical protein